MRNKLVFDSESGKWVHTHRKHNDVIQRYKKGSHASGTLVEFVGKDKKKRGLGMVMHETNSGGAKPEDIGTTHWDGSPVKDEDFACVRVFWQNLLEEEVVHKAFVKKVPEQVAGIIRKKK